MTDHTETTARNNTRPLASGIHTTPRPRTDVATARAEAAHAIDQATDHMRRAAVCLAHAITQARHANLPTPGCTLTLNASIDTLRDQIDIDGQERDFLLGLAADALLGDA